MKFFHFCILLGFISLKLHQKLKIKTLITLEPFKVLSWNFIWVFHILPWSKQDVSIYNTYINIINTFFKPYHLHFLWQSSEHAGAIFKIREKFFSLDICCQFLLMDRLKQKIFLWWGTMNMVSYFYSRLMENYENTKTPFKRFLWTKSIFLYIHIFE